MSSPILAPRHAPGRVGDRGQFCDFRKSTRSSCTRSASRKRGRPLSRTGCGASLAVVFRSLVLFCVLFAGDSSQPEGNLAHNIGVPVGEPCSLARSGYYILLGHCSFSFCSSKTQEDNFHVVFLLRFYGEYRLFCPASTPDRSLTSLGAAKEVRIPSGAICNQAAQATTHISGGF